MQAKRKLTALLLSLCMLLGMLPMTAFAAGVPAAPTNLKLELTETGLKASWDKPETTGGLDIFEYEVTLYGHFDGTAGEKTKVETKTVQRETTCTFTNTGNAEGVINPTYEVEVRAREGVSGTGDPDNLSGYYVTEWTGWSSSSSASYKTYDFSVITSVNKYYTGVVDVGLPGSENKLHQEGITATGNPDVIKPDGTTSENEKQAVTELLYQYFEKNKATVPELANVTRDNLMVKTVLERIESSRTVDPNNYQIIYEVVDKDYTLYLEFNPETEIVQPDTREIVNAVNLVNVSWNVGMGLTPAFTATVDEADQDKYEVYLEQWIGSDGKSITSEESFNSEISEDEKITTFEEGVTYYYSVWVKAKEGYAISEEASVYLDGRPADNGYTLANNDEPKRPDGSFLSGTFNSLFVMECVFDPLKVNGIEVTSANKDDILGDADGLGATVSYDPDTNTLTLNNATLTVSEDFAAIHALIPDLTIVLKGENQINGSGSTENGIYSNGDLTITGSGRLQIRGTGFGLYGNSAITLTGGADVDIIVDFSSAEAPQPYSAVRALGGLTVDGAALAARNSGEIGGGFGAPGISTSLTAKNGADVSISSTYYDAIPYSLAVSGEGTKVLARSESSDHYGIGADGVENTITISDGATVTAIGGKGAMKSKPDLTGYTNSYIKAGTHYDSATEVTDPANTDYHMNTFVEIKAGETPIDSFTYEINGESVTITGYTGSEGNVTIPSEIDGKPVTAIGESAFWECDKLESITFEGRTAPELGGDGVFDGCTALTAIHVPCGADGYTAANGWPEDKVQKSEHRMDRHLRVPATCTTDGTIEHWRCALCGGYFLDEAGTKEISEEQIVEKATGHDWGEPVWNWSDDGKTATVTFTCKRDEKHTAEPDVTVTQEVKTPATCTEKGVAVDTAKAVLDGKEYTSINENSAVEIAALGHKAEKVEGKAPTATEPGNIEYWYCPQCDTYFKDAGLTEVITKEQTVLAPTGETKPEPSKPDETPAAPTDPPQDKPDKTDDTTESPQTGDSSDMALWIGLMLASCGVLGMLFYRRKKAAAGK